MKIKQIRNAMLRIKFAGRVLMPDDGEECLP